MSKSTIKHPVLTTAIEAQPTKAAPTPSVAATEQAAAEAVLKAKYPHLTIVPGSRRFHVEGKYEGKNVVQIVCPACKTKRERATSDLFTCKSGGICKTCLKAAKAKTKKTDKIDLDAVKAEIEIDAQIDAPVMIS